MSKQQTIQSLGTLVTLRSREVERLQVEMSNKTSMRERYRANLERLNALCAESGASGALPLALSTNCANYKQAVLELVETHRNDLHLHEADMAVTQRALTGAWQKREVLGRVLEQKQDDLSAERERRERKKQDDLAVQVWFRSK